MTTSTNTSDQMNASAQEAIPELDPELFQACIEMLGAIPAADAVMGGIASGRNAFGMLSTYLLPAFQLSLRDGDHEQVLDAVRSEGGSVVVVAIAITQNRQGMQVPNYGVFWRDDSDKASPWFRHVVTLDPFAVSAGSSMAARSTTRRG